MRRRLASTIDVGADVFRRTRAKFPPLGTGLRQAFAEGYDRRSLRADIFAGTVVAVVALPLSITLAIAIGIEPQHGLYAAIIAGIVVSLTGASRFQVTGPSATFVVILAPVASKYGLSGVLTVGMMAGVFLIALGAARLGRLIQYIPYPVTFGFTAGIALVIATLQIKDVFGLPIATQPEDYVARLQAYWEARGDARPSEMIVAAATVGLLVAVPRLTKRLPAPLVAIALVAGAAGLLHWLVPSFAVATIGSRFHTTIGGVTYAGIPPLPPLPMLPWDTEQLSYGYFRALAPAAFTIAMLGAIESLLSAVIADGMTGAKHDPNGELVALGLGNLVAPFFGGCAATGVLARTATNVEAGARSPIAATVHSLVVLASMLLLAPAIAFVPMASLAGLLLVVAWNMSEARHVVRMLRVSPKSDAMVLITCFLLTVVFDMIVAVGVGVVLAALLFMRRMAELTQAKAFASRDVAESGVDVPAGVVLYEIAGALFFGAARNAITQLTAVNAEMRAVIIDLGRVPAIDVTGLVALESIAAELERKKVKVIIAGPLPQPRSVFDHAELGTATIVGSRDEALRLAAELVEGIGPPSRRAVSKRSTSRPPPPQSRAGAS